MFWNSLPYQLKKTLLPQVPISTVRLIDKETFKQSTHDWITYFILNYKITEEDANEYLKRSSTISIFYNIDLFEKKISKVNSYGIFYCGIIDLKFDTDWMKITRQYHEGYQLEYDMYDRDNIEWTTLEHYQFRCLQNPLINNITKAVVKLDSDSYKIYYDYFEACSPGGCSMFDKSETQIHIFYDVESTYNILRDKICEYTSDINDNFIHTVLKQRLYNDVDKYKYVDHNKESLRTQIIKL